MTDGKPIKITKEALGRMPKRMARRLRPGLREEVRSEFEEWVQDMGYQAHTASPMLLQFLFEAFVGGWGAKTRQVKKKKLDHDR